MLHHPVQTCRSTTSAGFHNPAFSTYKRALILVV
jgi:hypothetical protein